MIVSMICDKVNAITSAIAPTLRNIRKSVIAIVLDNDMISLLFVYMFYLSSK